MTDQDPAEALLLILRPVRHPHAANAFRVIWNGLEVGSIGPQVRASGRTFWRWSIDDNGAPCRELTTMGDTIGRDDAMKQFGDAWNEYSADPDRIRHMEVFRS